MILLLDFDAYHSAGHLGSGRKGMALFFSKGCNIVSAYGMAVAVVVGLAAAIILYLV